MAKDQDSFELAVAIQALTARHEVLSIALQEALRTFSKAQADQCAVAVKKRVADHIKESPVLLVPQADEAVAHELSLVLRALGHQPTV